MPQGDQKSVFSRYGANAALARSDFVIVHGGSKAHESSSLD